MGPSVGDLRTIALFSRCSDNELEELSALFEALPRSSEDVVLFDIGQAADAIYLIAEGVALLESPEDEVTRLHPPALLGELGALTGVARSMKVTVRGARCYRVDALKWQQFLFERHGLGMRVLRDLLRVATEKIHRDQVSLGTMRMTAAWTQQELRHIMLELASVPGPVPASVAGARAAVDALITRNRRVRVRVVPSVTMPVALHLEAGTAQVNDLSRTHLSFSFSASAWAAGARLAGTLNLAGKATPISGKVIRTHEGRVTLELDAMTDDDAAPLEGYLTRAQLLDVLI
ncbi:MAG: hypothetical protein R3B48_04645 [Kofleriaceae bacterium]